ncbi:MAG: hypothetical protein ACLS29_01845 [Prevotellamassilia sp.]
MPAKVVFEPEQGKEATDLSPSHPHHPASFPNQTDAFTRTANFLLTSLFNRWLLIPFPSCSSPIPSPPSSSST